jgi:hypothetical protein
VREKQTPEGVRNSERGRSWARQAQASGSFGSGIRAHALDVAEREEKLTRGLAATSNATNTFLGRGESLRTRAANRQVGR